MRAKNRTFFLICSDIVRSTLKTDAGVIKDTGKGKPLKHHVPESLGISLSLILFFSNILAWRHATLCLESWGWPNKGGGRFNWFRTKPFIVYANGELKKKKKPGQVIGGEGALP